ncbi:MAG: SapB/AmfS family lanthipeptide [Pseudonocardiaceae bacterium]
MTLLGPQSMETAEAPGGGEKSTASRDCLSGLSLLIC